jgi:adenylylsulfate kinase-like enzyme
MTAKNSQVRWHDGRVPSEDRRRFFRQRPVTIWLTGLSAYGTSMLDYEFDWKRITHVLDTHA